MKRIRASSFDRPRSLSSLQDELQGLEQELATAEFPKSSNRNSNDPLITSMMHSEDPRWPWIGIEEGTEYVNRISRLKACAARRQVVADTVATCIVSDFVPLAARHDERLGEFIYDIDNNKGPLAVVTWRHSTIAAPVNSLAVSTRKEVPSTEVVETPPVPLDGAVDLNLGHYSDIYSTEDLVAELPVRSVDGFADTSNIARISKIVPWYDEFVESFRIKNVPSLARVTKLVRLSFIKLKILYWRLASLYHSMYTYYWLPVTVARRVEILQSNFPRGILGYRALSNPDDPRMVRALVMKEADNKRLGVRRHLQTFSSAVNADEKEPNKDEGGAIDGDYPLSFAAAAPINPHATLPDLAQVWKVGSLLPRVHFEDLNRIVDNMAHVEHESMKSMSCWSLGEVRLFLEKLAVHGKNFKRISASINDKSIRDCVEFYYRFKIHLNMKAVIAAGSVSRQDRRSGGGLASSLSSSSYSASAANRDINNSNQSTPVINSVNGGTSFSYRAMIDEIMENLESDLGGADKILTTKSMEVLNLKYAANSPKQVPTRPRTPMSPSGDESPRRERRNAMIDIIVAAIGKGQPVPQELGVVETFTPPLTPGLLSSVNVEAAAPYVIPPPPVPPRRVSLSVVQTEISVLTLAEERTLQPHHTI